MIDDNGFYSAPRQRFHLFNCTGAIVDRYHHFGLEGLGHLQAAFAQ